ncbi:response regulator [Flavobacterium beibuense]|uniref:CheY-like receiver domain-containing protein n=1 Tax=Flavobacterium beibuense TaxID=657326 RepID=A0A444W8X5_9FLAO|nr:response regulator [Flavobacterium beibuense]RYJ42330.1 CheY-like receiver domain-containing protein [Flavobacterium beibuense]
MNIHGDIIIIEDDADDRDILISIFEELGKEHNYENRLVFIEDATHVIDFLKSDDCDPFLIISDINMPVINGFDLRNLIFNDAKIRERAIPFIFLTTSDSSEENMRKAFQLSIQGYFTKPISYTKFKKVINDILIYWKNAATN